MSSFTFQWPLALLLLVGAAPLAWLLYRSRKKKAAVREAWGQVKGTQPAFKRDWCWLISFILLVLALARPGYSPVRFSISNTGRDVVFILDVSRSMLAMDTFPSRLESAKQGIKDCLDSLGSEQVGLVIYGGSSSISSPLSSDYDFVRYMLDQVQPRSVEFGGTFLLSAMEKTVDQVLDSDRSGFQDVIVLTDGEDQAPNMDDVINLVGERSINLLVIGLGDSKEGSPIPVKDDDGSTTSLSHKGEIVYTVQQADELAHLASKCPGSKYINAGTLPYHLGDLYREFSKGKPQAAMDGDSGYTVYQEGAFLLLPFALLFAVIADPQYWKGAFRPAVVATAFAFLFSADGKGQEVDFDSASQLFEQGKFEEASLAFQSLMREDVPSQQVATLAFNRGLADWNRFEKLKSDSPREALSLARSARESFLLAARERSDFKRAKLRLGTLSSIIEGLVQVVQKLDDEEQEKNEAMQSLLERIEALLNDQEAFRAEIEEIDPQRSNKRRNTASTGEKGDLEPANSGDLSHSFSQKQADYEEEGTRIQEQMRSLNEALKTAALEEGNQAGLETVLSVPLSLMQQAVDAQGDAKELLLLWQNWPSARASQSIVEVRLQDILDQFSSNDSEEGDEEDWDEFEDYEMSDDGEGNPSSMAMEGSFKVDSEMQSLPVPNYSPEEILTEEMGSQQFRQEQRAKSNAGKVEKDW